MRRNTFEPTLSSPSTWPEAARHSLQRQLILRFALVFMLVTLCGSLLALLGYQMLVQQSQRRSADEALRHLERSYETQQDNWLRNADEVKSQIDFMRIFAQDDPAQGWLRLRAYFAAIEGKLDRFPSGVVLDGKGRAVFQYGPEGAVLGRHFSIGQLQPRWFYSAERRTAFKVLSVPLWLGPRSRWTMA